MIQVSSTYHNNIVSEVVGGMELSQLVHSDTVNIVPISFRGLSHHVLSVDIEVDILHSGFHVSVMVFLVFLTNLFFQLLKVISIDCAVADHIS